jgi:hypothetical protein
MTRGALAALTAGVLLLAGCGLQATDRKPRTTLFIGVDTSGSFENSGHYDDSLRFLAHYIYGHMNRLGGLEQPKALFVAAIGGKDPNEPKAFHPIHDFQGKNVDQIERDLRKWYVSPKVGARWRELVPRRRVRLWTVDGEVMQGWRAQVRKNAALARQEKLWSWIKDNVDYRVRSI